MSTSDATAPAPAHDDHGHGHGDHDHDHPYFLQHHFDTPVQQFDTAKLGMWLFLAQEILFFAGLFVAYGVYRSWYPDMFSVASHQLDRFIGGFNTIVLLLSSFTAAMAVRSSQLGKKNHTSIYLLITIACAFGFLIVKYFEYSHKIHAGLLPGDYFHPHPDHLHPPGTIMPDKSQVFFSIYFMLTGVHGLHVAVGIGVLFWIWLRNNKGEFGPQYFTPVDLAALYWHLVDLIWIYLFPLLYLID